MALSSNYALYGDMSARLMAVLGQFSPRQAIYSIDECFLNLAGLDRDPTATGQAMRRRVRRWLGLPVAVWIGPTQTLAKLANHLAKQEPAWAGVCDWGALVATDQEAQLAGLAVEETWGIGPRWGVRLRADGIATVRDLRAADPATLGRRYGVVVARIVRELRGSPCLALAEGAPPRQEILASRSFGRPVGDLAEVQTAVAHHVARAAAKLRAQGSQTQAVQVVLRPRRAGAATAPAPVAGWVRLAGPTADAARLTQAAVRAIAALVEPGRSYAGAGVWLLDLHPAACSQGDWITPGDADRTAARLAVLDRINVRWGRGTLRLAREGFSSPGPCARTSARRPIRPAGTTCRWCGRNKASARPAGGSGVGERHRRHQLRAVVARGVHRHAHRPQPHPAVRSRAGRRPGLETPLSVAAPQSGPADATRPEP